jgi:hypothetical protein
MLFPALNSGSNRACVGGDHRWVNVPCVVFGNMLRSTLGTLRAPWEVLKTSKNIRRTFCNLNGNTLRTSKFKEIKTS